MEDMKQRQGLNSTDIAVAAGVSKPIVSKWEKRKSLNDQYLWNIANSFSDERFKLAVLCYFQGIPAISLNILSKYQKSSLALLIGTQLEDLDSDSAIKDLIELISKPNPDIELIKQRLKEIQETSQIMNAAIDTVANNFGISIRDIALQRSH